MKVKGKGVVGPLKKERKRGREGEREREVSIGRKAFL